MRYLRLTLLPFSWLYGMIMDIRNRLYDAGIFKPVSFNLPVIAVGNLAAGGTGKTPMIEYIIRLLKINHKIATLSRGYRRQTSGFKIASPSDNASTIGDEPFQFYIKFNPEITVAVGEDRAYAIPHILNDHPDTDVLLMDDAFQHRRIKPNLEILVTDYTRLFYKDFILPAGLLRESRHGARRADVVVVTKCPEEISLDERGEITGNIRKYSGPEKPVFFSFIDYDDPKADGFKNRTIGEKIILVTGIANPEPLVKHLQSGYHVIKHFSFPDHHFFSKKDIDSMIRYYDLHGDKNVSFLFTEKDFMRLKGSGNEDKLTGYPVFFQPITYKFVAHGEEFDSMIIDSTGEFIN